MTALTLAQVHRFRDTVACYLGAGPTTYLSSKEARALSKALLKAARDCDRVPFTASTCGTVTVPLVDKRNEGG